MENVFTITNSTPCVSNHKSVLLIEDNPHRRNTLAIFLEMANFNVTLAGSASEGLALVSQGKFDLILIHSHPTRHHGAELCWRIRDFNKRTPILLYSGEAQSAETKVEWPLTPKQEMGMLPAYA